MDAEYTNGPSDARNTFVVAWADFDGDGAVDLFVGSGTVYKDTSTGSKTYLNNELWKNNGDGTLSEVSVPGMDRTHQPWDRCDPRTENQPWAQCDPCLAGHLTHLDDSRRLGDVCGMGGP